MNHNSEPTIGQSRYSTVHRIVALFFLIVGLAIYSNTFKVPPHFDDAYIYADITLEALLSRLTLSNTRLIADSTFAFNYWIAGPNVLGYHIFNLIIHVFTAFLVYQLLFQILRLSNSNENSPTTASANGHGAQALPPLDDNLFWPSFFAGLIFLVHPLATQAVTYITQRYTSFATLFYVASIVCYLKARSSLSGEQRPDGETSSRNLFFSPLHLIWYGLSIVAAVLAMYTKEMSLTLPVLLILVEFLLVQSNFEDFGKRVLYLLPLLATGLIIPYNHLPVFQSLKTFSVIETVTDADKILPRWAERESLSRSTYFFSQLGIIWSIYLKLLVWPWGQNIEHDFFVSNSLSQSTTLVAFLGLLSLLAIAALTIKRYRLLGFGILWFFVTLSITSSVIPNTIFVAEHRVYLSMIGLSFGVAGIGRYLKRPRLFWALAVSIVLTLSGLTFMRNNVWKDELTLWGDALKKSPNMGRPYNNYAHALHGAGHLDEAITVYKKVLTMPNVPYKSDISNKLLALANLGTVYAAKGMYREALQSYQAAVRLTVPQHAAPTYYNMGNLFAELQEYTKAAEAYKKAAEVSPGNYRAYTNLGWVLMTLERDNEAEAALKQALQYNSRAAEAYLNLGTLYSKDPARKGKAIDNYRQYLALKPNSPLHETVLDNIRRLEGEVRGY
jgi:tetratricopeptide (TPR) repeat protein